MIELVRSGRSPEELARAYDELGENGERILPFYNYIIIWQGLYTVHGGSIDWSNDGLGIISFSNELWNGGQYFNSPLLQEQQRDPSSPISGQKSRFFFDDFVVLVIRIFCCRLIIFRYVG